MSFELGHLIDGYYFYPVIGRGHCAGFIQQIKVAEQAKSGIRYVRSRKNEPAAAGAYKDVG